MTRTRPTAAIIGIAVLVAAVLIAVADARSVGAEPSATITPSRPLVDGETITLRGQGFQPGTLAAAAQCRSIITNFTQAFEDCDLNNFALGTVEPNGTITFRLVAHRFIRIRNQVIDCAEPGSCFTGIGTLSLPADPDVLIFEMVFDPSVANDPPLEVEVSVDQVRGRRVHLVATCDRPAMLDLQAALRQPRPDQPAALGFGERSVWCTDEVRVPVLAIPVDTETGTSNRFPRLVAGETKVRVDALGRVGRWRDRVLHRRTIDVAKAGLTGRASQPHDGVRLEVSTLRVSGGGRATASISLICSQPTENISVEVTLLANAPGGRHRQMRGSHQVGFCDSGVPVTVTLDRGDARAHREDIVPPGRVELYARAIRFPLSGEGTPVAARTVRTSRPILPATIQHIQHNPASPLRIGTATTSGVRASMRCSRTGQVGVRATIGQVTGTTVNRTEADGAVACLAGRTVAFTLVWDRPMPVDRRSAIIVQAAEDVNAGHPGPWPHRQSGHRLTY